MSSYNLDTRVVPCAICGTPTIMLGTKLCNSCWEVERQIPHGSEAQAEFLDKINAYRAEQEAKKDE